MERENSGSKRKEEKVCGCPSLTFFRQKPEGTVQMHLEAMNGLYRPPRTGGMKDVWLWHTSHIKKA